MEASREIVVGLDEVGRGPWAGPVVACAVVLGDDIDGLKDSKRLSALKRRVLADEIRSRAIVIGLGWVDSREIDSVGLAAATEKAFELAFDDLNLSRIPTEIIVDGNINYLENELNSRAVVKADQKHPSVMAASIIAKVERDEFMARIASRYPGYGFEKHVGYGTSQHAEALKSLGVCPIHRRSFKPIARMIA